MAPNAYTADQPHDQWWDPHNPLANDKQAVFMDWIEQGMDFFGCDENVPKKVFGGVDTTLRIPLEPHRATDPQCFDYAKLHDDLLDSLMAEQSRKASDPTYNPTDVDSSASSFSFSSTSQSLLNTSASTANSSFGYDDEETTAVSEVSEVSKRGHKRPRALKLHRRVMPALVNKAGDEKTLLKRRNSSASSFGSKSTSNTVMKKESLKKRDSNSDAIKVDLSELKDANFPPASSFIHPQCRLQKDKGKGEAAGSNICAKGREHCLLKLEQKMALLTRVAFGEQSKNKGKADMKRRPARIAEVFPNFTETRSIIELRMGFLSMQYGVLLRWDTTRTGKVTLVVLRKMCHESFYTVCKAPKKAAKTASPRRKMLQMPAELPSYAIGHVINGNHAILQRPDGLEVALLEPPYRVDRPEDFAPTLLSCAVQYGTGLCPKSQWTVQLCYDGTTENVLMTWDADEDFFTPKLGGTLKHEIPIHGSLELQSLEIRLFEHRQKRGKSRRCVAHMHVPLHGLEPQPSRRNGGARDLKVVSTHDPDAFLTISVLLESDYAHWLRQELDARRREEVRAFVWKSPVRVVDIFEPTPSYDVEEEEGLWEWICSAC